MAVTETQIAKVDRPVFRRRTAIGDRCIALAKDGPWSAIEVVDMGDRETYATDAVSHILTALFGASGIAADHVILRDQDAALNARTFLSRALESWLGDAEDYSPADVEVEV